MASELVKLKLRDMYAIKHALQNVKRQKEKRLEEIFNGKIVDNFEVRLQEEVNKLSTDIIHEGSLIAKFEEEIAEFRDKYHLLNQK